MNYQKLIQFGTVFSIICSLSACSSSQQQPFRTASRSLLTETTFNSITLQREGCFEFCSMYKVIISANGKVNYEGNGFVKVKGKVQTLLTLAQVKTLEKAITKVKFFSLQNKYIAKEDGCKEVITDAPATITTIS